MMTVKKAAFAAAITGALLAALFCALTYVPPEVKREVTLTGQVPQNVLQDAKEFGEYTEAHKTQTIERTVVIREQVRHEVLAYSPDELARAAMAEIELWRGSSGGSFDAGSSRLGGDR